MSTVGEFDLIRKIGTGSFGVVWECQRRCDGMKFAVKIPSVSLGNVSLKALQQEDGIYRILHNKGAMRNFPIMKFFDTPIPHASLDLLGNDLGQVRQQCPGERMGLQTILILTIKMLQLLETIHNKNIIHRDIKPENFVFGIGNNSADLYCIDFGLATHLTESGARNTWTPFMGTLRFASIAAHKGERQSFKDDLESCVYTLVYLFRGRLPWQKFEKKKTIFGSNSYTKNILKSKETISAHELCRFLPPQYEALMVYARERITSSDIPCYEDWISVFRHVYESRDYSCPC